MAQERSVRVHLTPELARPGALAGALALVIDVLRATTTIVHALAAGCLCVRPCLEIEEAKETAADLPADRVLLAGERGGVMVPGFDLGNSPLEFTASRCKSRTIVLTTSNGTRAILRAAEAERVLIAAFTNFSAVCEQLRQDARPVHIVCAGNEGQPTLEDTLLAGAFVDFLCEEMEVTLNDSARLAWDCFENHGRVLEGALEISEGGVGLRTLGHGVDIPVCAQVDKFALVPELKRDPLRLERGSAGIVKKHWQR